MNKKIYQFLGSMSGISVMSILVYLEIKWYFIVAVIILDVAIYAFALIEREKFHGERYEELSRFNERLIDMLPERQQGQKSNRNKPG